MELTILLSRCWTRCAGGLERTVGRTQYPLGLHALITFRPVYGWRYRFQLRNRSLRPVDGRWGYSSRDCRPMLLPGKCHMIRPVLREAAGQRTNHWTEKRLRRCYRKSRVLFCLRLRQHSQVLFWNAASIELSRSIRR